MKQSLAQLEQQMVTYTQLTAVNVLENNESFTVVSRIPSEYQPSMSDMTTATGDTIFVRMTVEKMLWKAQMSLQSRFPHYTLLLTYGYRSMEIQTEKFVSILQKTSQTFFPNPIDLYEEVHRYVAVPTVAGHPTGGAVDLLVKDMLTGQFLDFGSPIYDFTNKKPYTFYPNLSKTAQQNRRLLRDCMLQAGFAPYDGEWWHFSYGDREWAYYYHKPYAPYAQVTLKDMLSAIVTS